MDAWGDQRTWTLLGIAFLVLVAGGAMVFFLLPLPISTTDQASKLYVGIGIALILGLFALLERAI